MKLVRKITILFVLCLILISVAACSGKDVVTEAPYALSSDNPKVSMVIKDFGTIELELDAVAAPETVANFIRLVNDNFYDGLTFHRIIEDFMIQGGDPNGDGSGGSEKSIKGEFASNGVENPLSHEPGVISMARTNDPDSASSQFFIVTGDALFLDGEYAAFGHVTSGMDVVKAIAKVPTDKANDKPLEPVVIESIREIK
jgi:peptidyl-prolyl cis-trans isomerase B (cyclophilin B)